MPIYEYECVDCKKKIEVIQRLSDPAGSCPECGGQLKRLLSAPAFQFKGSGWYVTDYANKGRPKEEVKAGSGDDGEKPASTSGKGSGETKPSSKETSTSAKSGE